MYYNYYYYSLIFLLIFFLSMNHWHSSNIFGSYGMKINKRINNNFKIKNVEICTNLNGNVQLFELLDRMCSLCTDMFYLRSGLKENCSFNCFRNKNFVKCSRLFKPIIGGSTSLKKANKILKEMSDTFIN
ncbi:hypothetical protein Mgra_00000475 [Meloidogyne graminicola]|uniref:Uncharacterized protein n=1 Tax=Meloidogyne graminicola TaxID=189291 RepID=A0A8T0A390_9BILA|nr:hypothetical protein Mgra_00000475 [Meloidogyne graminicola]